MISLLVAMDKNNVIGYEGDLPWHLPKDLKFFKERTIGNNVIMGRKTFDSIGRALPKRKNVVLTRSTQDFPDDIIVVHDVDEIYKWNEENPAEELFVIGGGHIFEQMIEKADRMYITYIDHSFKGDTFFPSFSEDEWELTRKVKGEKDEKNPYHYYFCQYDRKK